MFRFKYVLLADLPKLAWLAAVDKSSRLVTVWHGTHVECMDSFFVAGVWDGDFEKAEFEQSSVFYGTGAKRTAAGVAFVTPSHALERLVLAENDQVITVSNSLPFLLAYHQFELDSKIDQYESMLCSILDGPLKCREQIPMKNGKFIRQYIVSNIEVCDDMHVEVKRRAGVPPFSNFDDYYGRMLTAMSAVKENAVSPGRKQLQYGVLSTISSGYDSSTCALVAKKIGGKQVATLMSGKYDKDSGEEVARQLGYRQIIKRDCQIYKDKPDCIDAEYVCSGEQASQLQFCVFEDVFADHIVFFGSRGSYWEKASGMTDDFEMGGYYYFETDVSWTENALKNGYIVLPLPTYGSSTCSSIRKISNAEEMKPWTLNTTYDKPIPRRILEESGVSREAFGTVKYGGGFSFCYDTKGSLAHKMSKAGYESFVSFVKQTGQDRRSIFRLLHRVKFLSLSSAVYFNAIAKKLGIKPMFKHKAIRMSNPGVPSDLIFWGTEIMKARYTAAMQPAESNKIGNSSI